MKSFCRYSTRPINKDVAPEAVCQNQIYKRRLVDWSPNKLVAAAYPFSTKEIMACKVAENPASLCSSPYLKEHQCC